jgi:hypothetical protein
MCLHGYDLQSARREAHEWRKEHRVAATTKRRLPGVCVFGFERKMVLGEA